MEKRSLRLTYDRSRQYCAPRKPGRYTCAIICFCVSNGMSRKDKLPSDLFTSADVPIK